MKLISIRLITAAFVVVLGACAPLTKVVLLPQADGSASAVLVKTAKYEQLLSTPYQRVSAQEDKALKADTTTAAEVQKAYPQLYASMPPRPTKYVLNFMPGGTTLTPESQAQLPKILEDATNRSGADLVVTGHTDSTGALAANDTLSLSRAKVVSQLLIDKGAAASRLEAVGRGKRELLVPTADEVDEPQNRRVEIIVR
ncbi:MAG: OmpA family protein [Burkholderiaceae bacterium]